jgi:hypothetical protein
MKLAGWNNITKSTIESGEGLERPIVRKWVSVRGETLTVQRHHTVDMDGIDLTPEAQIPDDEAKWYVQTSWGACFYHDVREDAINDAMSLMREFYTDDEIDAAKAEIDDSNEFFSDV